MSQLSHSREQMKQAVMIALEKLRQRGMSSEQIAVSTKVSYGTVLNWRKGRRIPRAPMIDHLEQVLRIKILP